MDDLQIALVARLTGAVSVSAIVGNALHWGKVPEGTKPPYVRLTTVSDPRPQNLKAYERARPTRVRAEAFADRYETARALSQAMIHEMAQPATVGGVKFGRTRAFGPTDGGEDVPNGFVHRLSTDLLIEHAPN